MKRTLVVAASCLLLGCGQPEIAANALDELAASMSFYASFEDGMDAAYARDDRRIYSAPSYDAVEERGPWYWGEDVQIAYDQGIVGHALGFNGKLTQALFYTAEGNTPWTEGGAISLWLRPDGLAGAPLAVVGNDPLAPVVAVDLSPEPAELALRAIQGEGHVTLPSMEPETWIHVVLSVSSGAPGTATVYVDGAEATTFEIADPDRSWESARTTVRLGVDYVGLLDELAVFDRAVTADEARLLHETPNLPASLMR